MISSLYTSIKYALDNIRLNFFHTMLSVLGIIIGVSALITMLAMIDGLEQFAENQIKETTSLNMVQVSSVKTDNVDGISIRRDNPVIITDTLYREMMSVVKNPSVHYRYASRGKEITHAESKIGTILTFADTSLTDGFTMVFGRNLYDLPHHGVRIAVINSELAKKLTKNDFVDDSVLGTSIHIDEYTYEIVGVMTNESKMNAIYIPIDFLTGVELSEYPPIITIEAEQIEDVQPIKDALDHWLESSEFTSDDIIIASNEFRVE